MDKVSSFQTRIGKIISALKIPSLTDSRDIGGAIVTNTGRIVIAAGSSDGELNHPYHIVISDDYGKNVRKVFSLPAEKETTYHTLGLAYDRVNNIIVSVLGRNRGYHLLNKPYGKMLPFSWDYCGNNEVVVVRSWDDGETWHTKEIPVEKPENYSGIIGSGVIVNNEIFFPQQLGSCDPEGKKARYPAYLSRLKNIPKEDGTFDCEYENKFRTLASNSEEDVRFANEAIYIEKVDGSGYISFFRTQPGPPYRREYDLNHNPICEFERCKVNGFDRRDYDPSHNGPLLVAFGIIRMVDGNLLYASRFYGTTHHRGGNIFMTSRDEGRTWGFMDDHIPWTLDPLQFANSGYGGNPQMYYGPDGKLIHITTEQLLDVRILDNGDVCMSPPPKGGGFALCVFEGITTHVSKSQQFEGIGEITIDVSTMTKIDPVFISKIRIISSNGLTYAKEDEDLYYFSSDAQRVLFKYQKVKQNTSIQFEIVLGNRNNCFRPIFFPGIQI